MPDLHWRKSSYSAEAANCVCVAIAPDGTVLLGDSKAPGTTVTTTRRALHDLISAITPDLADHNF
ncbi:hypothetical protein GCM10020367_18500 [Streptomyces sannanensis]|uniref:DUF397 domain-containing protein n=1 Tax=Streptomyces sannanensis TaxID=285536 RepID=A0ABP6S8F2_9ACTN